MKSIIYITDPAVLAIPIIENGEHLIDLKDKTELQFGPPPETELTKDHYTKMRQSVFEKLCRAQNDLANGWKFRVYEGFRTREVQKILFDNEYKKIAARNPHKKHEEIFYEATRLSAPVENLDGSLNIPPHNTGAAVDIEIITQDGQLVDMGMEAKDWVVVEPDLCLTECSGLHEEAKRNRKILCDVMQAQDFVNYPTEWWHFSYGDRYWAYHKKQPHAIYGAIS